MNRPFNLLELIKIILKWKVPIVIFVLIAAIGGVVVSLLLDNYYKSKSIFYPTNLSITDRQMLFSEATGDMLPSYFGNRQDVERVLTITKSDPLIDYMVNKFNLHKVYDIDTTNEDWRFRVKREFKSNFTAKKTKLGAVKISILDTDPQRAAKMVNSMVNVIDKQNSNMVTNMKSGIVKSFEQKLKEKKQQVNKLTDTLSALKRRYDVKKINSSNKTSQEATYQASDPGVIEQYKVLEARHENALDELNKISSLFEQYELSAKQDVSSLYILEKAFPANKKSKPIRWVICVTTTLLAILFAIIGAVMAEKFKDLRQALEDDQ